MATDRQHVHQLLDRLDSAQLAAIARLLEVIVEPGAESLTGEDRAAVAASRKWFGKNPDGIPFEQVLADHGLTLDDLKHYRAE